MVEAAVAIRRDSKMPGDLARAFAFMRRGDMRGTDETLFRFGTAVLTPELPNRQDSNLLYLDRLTPGTAAAELQAEAERIFTDAEMSSRVLVFPDAETGEALVPEFPGWNVHRQVVMVHRRPPEVEADTSSVVEVGEAVLRPARRAEIESYPWGSRELAEQLLDAKVALARWQSVRCFAMLAGSEVASYTDLYSEATEAQVEDVATLPPYRGRGYAKAVVSRAVEEARAGGADFVFLVAREDDWPTELYRRLGFDVVGRYVKLFRDAA
jgi:ribosomal protein S18 acetylase RimI-like enzyme